jgi:hypothetical protein
MHPALKAAVMAGGGYLATLGILLVACFVAMVLLSPSGCAALGGALMVLWGILALGALSSAAAVGALLWRLELPTLARAALGGGYALAIAGTCAVVAFFLMIGFNC